MCVLQAQVMSLQSAKGRSPPRVQRRNKENRAQPPPDDNAICSPATAAAARFDLETGQDLDTSNNLSEAEIIGRGFGPHC